jgi:cephalosporin hydroxylase
MLKEIRGLGIAITVLVAVFVSACTDILSDSKDTPWIGYAWNKGQRKFEWMLVEWKTKAACMKTLKEIIATQNQWYTTPIGCAYSGNSYWRVRIMNMLYGGKDLGCITISEDIEQDTAKGILYYPILGRTSTPPEGAKRHCVK